MKVRYANIKYNKESYKMFSFRTVIEGLEVGDVVVLDNNDIVTFIEYTKYESFLEPHYRWIIGEIDLDAMRMEHGCRLWDNGINPKTGSPYESDDWRDWKFETGDEVTYNGLKCNVCDEPQFDTTSGTTCKNGHGGEDGY